MPRELVLPEGFVPAEVPDPPVEPRDSATVMLVRDGAAGMEVFLLRRVAGMAFAGGMTAFPGGSVDPRDADASVAWHGPEPRWWADRFGVEEGLARALVCAAVRETFEESGVLLAGPDATSVVSDTAPFAAARRGLVDRELSLAAFLAEAGLVVRADLLRPWANWVTPIEERRRFDTRFFLAAVPSGQHADGATSEATDAGWYRPTDALDDWKHGRRGLLPPTWTTLAELEECGSVDAAMASERTITKLVPRVVRDGGVLRIVIDGDAGYADAANQLDATPDDRVQLR
ncbi:MAG TPA: NUDIX hydrolase [Actinophytocola sp.]|uniref:NUDIX hydrolase n=1 Tax=Actinophytocola sp. TaxID=1872138 RepID=UPI002DDD706F|nr:NUDIX hydrolase [Actinophytocola sp.]HEV2782480.1 NUDIX hydrolase [Actinophytocola sp.]